MASHVFSCRLPHSLRFGLTLPRPPCVQSVAATCGNGHFWAIPAMEAWYWLLGLPTIGFLAYYPIRRAHYQVNANTVGKAVVSSASHSRRIALPPFPLHSVRP